MTKNFQLWLITSLKTLFHPWSEDLIGSNADLNVWDVDSNLFEIVPAVPDKDIIEIVPVIPAGEIQR